MQCTSCQAHTLQPKELEKGLVGASCPNCEGLLLSLINYRYWVERNTADMSPSSDEELLIEEEGGARICPKCARLMTKYRMSAKAENRIDLCTGCDEAWLDKDEWHLLKRLDIATTMTSIFTDHWQRQISTDQRISKLKARYQELLGEEDFVVLDRFKEWLDKHPNQEEIKRYINASLK